MRTTRGGTTSVGDSEPYTQQQPGLHDQARAGSEWDSFGARLLDASTDAAAYVALTVTLAVVVYVVVFHLVPTDNWLRKTLRRIARAASAAWQAWNAVEMGPGMPPPPRAQPIPAAPPPPPFVKAHGPPPPPPKAVAHVELAGLQRAHADEARLPPVMPERFLPPFPEMPGLLREFCETWHLDNVRAVREFEERLRAIPGILFPAPMPAPKVPPKMAPPPGPRRTVYGLNVVQLPAMRYFEAFMAEGGTRLHFSLGCSHLEAVAHQLWALRVPELLAPHLVVCMRCDNLRLPGLRFASCDPAGTHAARQVRPNEEVTLGINGRVSRFPPPGKAPPKLPAPEPHPIV